MRAADLSYLAKLPDLRARLAHGLTHLDRTEGKGSPYRLGIYLRAGDEVADAVDAGTPLVKAFADAFTPTRGMHRLAVALGLPLDVERGRWVEREACRLPLSHNGRAWGHWTGGKFKACQSAHHGAGGVKRCAVCGVWGAVTGCQNPSCAGERGK
jgi:hypothetical protein